MKAVILAGGKGTRLAPYTTVFPKPLMPIGETPIIDIVIRQLIYYGFNDITLSVGYLAELIQAYCGDGSKCGVQLNYVKEEFPLGTVGSLSLIPDLTETFLLINGDILTTLPFDQMFRHHKSNGSVLTLAVRKRTVQIDFGVIEQMNEATNQLMKYTEKPVLEYTVGMGICVFEPKVLQYIQPNQPLDIPELLNILISHGEIVYGYLSDDYWLDIGRPDDYQQAQRDFEKMKQRFLPNL